MHVMRKLLGAAMGVVVREVRRRTDLAVGVNLLRNACLEALQIAAVTGADFIRCNIVIGAYVTDQGIIQGCAAELARLRMTLDRDIAVLGDVHVKHAAPLFDVPIEDAAHKVAGETCRATSSSATPSATPWPFAGWSASCSATPAGPSPSTSSTAISTRRAFPCGTCPPAPATTAWR